MSNLEKSKQAPATDTGAEPKPYRCPDCGGADCGWYGHVEGEDGEDE